MRIGIDCRTILSPDTGELAGTAHYTYELVRHLLQLQRAPLQGSAKVPFVFVLFFDARLKKSPLTPLFQRGVAPFLPPLEKGDRGGFKNVEIVFLPVLRVPFITTHFSLSRALARAKLDLFHSPAHPLPIGYRGKSVWTVHDLAIYNHPEWFPGGARQWFSTRVTVPRSIQRSVKLIAPSESTKRDIMRIFNVPDGKIKVIYEGKPEIKLPVMPPSDGTPPTAVASYQLPVTKFYFLFIGTIEPRKNLVRLIDAFIQFRKTYNLTPNTHNLVLTGSNGWNNADIFMAIERANLKLGKGSVQYLGYVSEEEKATLLKNATAFVWPSLYEGFGLPVLEAMAAGVPVITSNISSIPEITGDAALLVNPESIDEIVTEMKKIVSNDALREQLKTRGVNRAKQFTWEKMARETLAVYRDAMSRQTAG